MMSGYSIVKTLCKTIRHQLEIHKKQLEVNQKMIRNKSEIIRNGMQVISNENLNDKNVTEGQMMSLKVTCLDKEPPRSMVPDSGRELWSHNITVDISL